MKTLPIKPAIMHYFVFSIGQFFASDVNVLKQKLTNLYAKYGHPEITGEKIWEFLTQSKDTENKTPLHYLRLGMQLSDFWKTKIQTQFPLASSAVTEENLFKEFYEAWISMCQFTDATNTRIRAFIDFLKEHPDTHFILVSHTNHAHFDYIQKQIIEEFKEGFPASQMHFITSMASQKEDHPDTLNYAFETNIIPLQKDTQVISCLKTIPQGRSPSITDYHELPASFSFDDFNRLCLPPSPGVRM